MSVGLDTSVVLRLLTGAPNGQAAVAHSLLAKASSPLCVSDLVIAESYFALRHHYLVPHSEAVHALGALLDDPRVSAAGTAKIVLSNPEAAREAKSEPGLVDRLIHQDYARDGQSLVTFDRALAKLPGVRLLT